MGSQTRKSGPMLTYSWEQESAMHRSYVVRDGAGVAGRLHWIKRWDNVAQANHSGQTWVLERRGILRQTATIKTHGEPDEIARLERKGLGGAGSLIVQDGETLIWKPRGMLSSDWNLIEPASERVLIAAKVTRSFPRDKGEIHILEDRFPIEMTVPLAYFSLYLVVLALTDAAVAVS